MKIQFLETKMHFLFHKSYKLLKCCICLNIFLSTLSISGGNTVKVNTDKKKIKGSGATAGQIMIANSINGKIKAEWSDFTVGSSQITDGSIAATDIADGTISSADIAADAITASELANTSITSPKFANGAIPATFVVDAAGNGHFTTIQAAIDALPNSGGKIFVNAGQYNENCTISTAKTIIEGCGPSTIISASSGTAVNIIGTNVVIRDLAIQSLDTNGIAVFFNGTVGSKVMNCEISADKEGIRVEASSKIQIFSNNIETITPGSNNAIRVYNNSSLVLIQANNIITPDHTSCDGIEIENTSSRCSVIGNFIQAGSAGGIFLSGSTTASTYTSVIGNTIEGNGSNGGIYSTHSDVVIAGNISIDPGNSIMADSTFAKENSITGNLATGILGTFGSVDGAHAVFGNIADNISISSDTTTEPGDNSATVGTLNDPDEMNVDLP